MSNLSPMALIPVLCTLAASGPLSISQLADHIDSNELSLLNSELPALEANGVLGTKDGKLIVLKDSTELIKYFGFVEDFDPGTAQAASCNITEGYTTTNPRT